MIVCKICNYEYSKDGELYLPYNKRTCRNCYNKRQKQKMRDRFSKDEESYFYYLMQQINRRNKVVNIDEKYLVKMFEDQDKKCKVTGIPLKINNSSRKYNSISIDRIDNNKGYIRGNIQIVCYGYNSMKSDFDEEVFKLMLERAYKYHIEMK